MNLILFITLFILGVLTLVGGGICYGYQRYKWNVDWKYVGISLWIIGGVTELFSFIFMIMTLIP